jgi:16S rRNA (cytosine967-C5)-methyltransferase
VYSTCTISKRENQDRIAAVLEEDAAMRADELGAVHPELAMPGERRFLQTRPDRHGTDGFFIASLTRETDRAGSRGEG